MLEHNLIGMAYEYVLLDYKLVPLYFGNKNVSTLNILLTLSNFETTCQLTVIEVLVDC